MMRVLRSSSAVSAVAIATASAVITAIGAPALADDPYVRFNYARTFQDATVTDSSGDISATADLDVAGGNLLGFAIGTDLDVPGKWKQFSWEGEFAYRNAGVNGAEITGSVPNAFIAGADLDDVSVYTLMGNIWWRPEVFGQWRPYAGGGVGGAYLPAGGLSNDDIYALAYQFGFGVDYEFENGVRAGLGFRRFETGATDVDDDDPIFVFETDSDVSENAVYLNATVPFAFISGDRFGSRRADASAVSGDDASTESKRVERARKRAAKQAEKAEKERQRLAEKARKDAEKKQEGEKKKSFFAKLNPFSGDAATPPPLRDGSATPKKAPTKKASSSSPSEFDNIQTASVRNTPTLRQGSVERRTLAQPAPAPQKAAAMKPLRTATTATSASYRKTADGQLSAAAQKTSSKGGYFAQLGAYSSQSFAEEMWRRKSGKQPDVLNGASYFITPYTRRADKRDLYLLRVGPFERSDAKSVCALIAGECFVVGG